MNNLKNVNFIHRCLSDSINGLRDGLTHFSGTSRVAVIFCLTSSSNLSICDPQSLLRGYDPRLETLFLQGNDWQSPLSTEITHSKFSYIQPQKDLQLDGIISHGGRSDAVFYQMWFTEHHPDMCSTGPTQRWLEHAVLRFSHDVISDQNLYTGVSGNFLREYASHAVHDHIVDEINYFLGWDSQIRVYPVLDKILAISKTIEEGVLPYGELVFVEPDLLGDIDYLARFSTNEQPTLDDSKHVRKLLQAVENSQRKLISDGQHILGVSSHNLPRFSFTADFHGRHGFLKINREKICSFSDGSYKSSIHRAKLFEVEEALLETNLEATVQNELFQIISQLVHNAETQKFGCTLVLNLDHNLVRISGQNLASPIDLRHPDLLNLAAALSRVDGALHIGADFHLHRFACLLDGQSIVGENRARGARYNSSVRFSAVHNNLIVVVVSADRPVSIFQNGIEISGQCYWQPISSCIFKPEQLHNWLTAF